MQMRLMEVLLFGNFNQLWMYCSRPLANGKRGEVYEVNGDRVSVIFDINEVEVESVNVNRKPPIYWINVNNIEHDLDAQSQDCYIAMEALCEV